MFYCNNCRLLNTEPTCSYCGNRKLCEPKVNDPVYLTTKDFFESGIIEGALEENNIPFEKAGALGRGVTLRAGSGLESFTFYIPYGAYTKCLEILAEIFGEDV